ncbi:hypothetical protein C8T65DRAFT_746560 [Cerioporus squamosus]|nr:hypothetical protein C8T65DRAFT_746560 [Cerioporus squamosus]
MQPAAALDVELEALPLLVHEASVVSLRRPRRSKSHKVPTSSIKPASAEASFGHIASSQTPPVLVAVTPEPCSLTIRVVGQVRLGIRCQSTDSYLVKVQSSGAVVVVRFGHADPKSDGVAGRALQERCQG